MPTDTLSRYALAGITLASALRLPELGPPAPHVEAEAEADWTLRLSSSRPQAPPDGWFHYWNGSNGRRWLSFGRDRGGYVLRFSQTATFRVSPEHRSIECEGAARVPAKTVRHLFLNQVFPLALSRTRRFVLHGSAVAMPWGSIGFAGATGAGKSTLAAALSRDGADFITDDALMLDPAPPLISGHGPRSGTGQAGQRFVAVPMYGSVRLWPDSAGALFGSADAHPPVAPYTNKRAIAMHALPSRPLEPLPLGLLCLLGPRESLRRARDVSLHRVRPRDAVIRLTSLAFQLDVHDRAELRDRFERLSAIVDSVPIVELTFPWALHRMARTAAEIRERLARFDDSPRLP